MPRTTPTKVRGIVTDLREDSTIDLTAAIETANVFVTSICIPFVKPDGTSLSAIELEMVERWLAAHFWSVDNPKLLMEIIGRSQDTIQGKVDLGLRLTHYGQQALILSQGALAPYADGKPKQIKMRWLGRTRAQRERRPNQP